MSIRRWNLTPFSRRGYPDRPRSSVYCCRLTQCRRPCPQAHSQSTCSPDSDPHSAWCGNAPRRPACRRTAPAYCRDPHSCRPHQKHRSWSPAQNTHRFRRWYSRWYTYPYTVQCIRRLRLLHPAYPRTPVPPLSQAPQYPAWQYPYPQPHHPARQLPYPRLWAPHPYRRLFRRATPRDHL